MVAESRESWRLILDEGDDDHEWIPSPRQNGVVPNVKITQDMVDQWRLFLEETDGLLAGRKLLGHWRVSDGRGINLSRVFTEPRDFDLVLWIQGSAAAPYLEQGDVSRREVWDRLQNVFRGVFGFYPAREAASMTPSRRCGTSRSRRGLRATLQQPVRPYGPSSDGRHGDEDGGSEGRVPGRRCRAMACRP